MADILMIAMVLGFFAVCVAYVSWCGRIIGPDDDGPGGPDGSAHTHESDPSDAELVAS